MLIRILLIAIEKRYFVHEQRPTYVHKRELGLGFAFTYLIILSSFVAFHKKLVRLSECNNMLRGFRKTMRYP